MDHAVAMKTRSITWISKYRWPNIANPIRFNYSVSWVWFQTVLRLCLNDEFRKNKYRSLCCMMKSLSGIRRNHQAQHRENVLDLETKAQWAWVVDDRVLTVSQIIVTSKKWMFLPVMFRNVNTAGRLELKQVWKPRMHVNFVAGKSCQWLS
jgi:hypothetical protein